MKNLRIVASVMIMASIAMSSCEKTDVSSPDTDNGLSTKSKSRVEKSNQMSWEIPYDVVEDEILAIQNAYESSFLPAESSVGIFNNVSTQAMEFTYYEGATTEIQKAGKIVFSGSNSDFARFCKEYLEAMPKEHLLLTYENKNFPLTVNRIAAIH